MGVSYETLNEMNDFLVIWRREFYCRMNIGESILKEICMGV